MRHPSRWRLPAGIGILAGAVVLGTTGLAAPAFASSVPVGAVSSTPATGTPELVYGNGVPNEQIYVMKQCGNTIYVGGTFSQITQDGVTYTRNNLFAFSAIAPYTLSSWDPNVNGAVHALAVNSASCPDLFVGGDFTEVGSTAASDLAEISTSTGLVNTAFGHSANGEVDTMIAFQNHILTGGEFTEINGSSADPYYASLNNTTGLNDGYLDLNVHGNYQYSGVTDNPTRIYEQEASHAGSRVMVEGDFTSVGNQARQQVFQLWLDPNKGAKAVVTAWNAPVFDTHCDTSEPMYAKSAAWSPSDSEVYVASTGGHTYLWNNQYPLKPPCDAAMAFSASETKVPWTWSIPTGCDSLLGVAADDYAVYFAGHERWTNNWDACNTEGTGAIQDYGMEGLNPANGQLWMNAAGTAPAYTMSRADGQYLMTTSAGLWIGSTNRFGDNVCNGVSNLSGVCFLPYPSS